MKAVELVSHRTTRRTPPAPQACAAIFVVLACSVALISSVFGVGPVRAQPRVPDFNGVWGKYTYSYPKPYMKGRSIADGYNNALLKPWVVESLMRDDMVAANGQVLATAHSLCYPEGVPYVFGETRIQILQGKSEITMLFGGEQEQSRTIYMDRPHSAHVVPSWYGESVGHFEGDSLVVDTVGIAAKPQAGSMGFFGTPHTEALHLVERYRFLAEGETSLAQRRPPPNPRKPQKRGKEIAGDFHNASPRHTPAPPAAPRAFLVFNIIN